MGNNYSIRRRISTNDILQILIELLDRKIQLKEAYEKMQWMRQQIDIELQSYAERRVIIEKPEEWCINNMAKAETRAAILETLLQYMEKKLNNTGAENPS